MKNVKYNKESDKFFLTHATISNINIWFGHPQELQEL